MAPRTQINSATLIMGVTGSGKSSLLATLADYVFDRWGLKTVYNNSDGGGFPAEIQARIAAGIMIPFRMRTRDPGDLGLAFETCQRVCQGWLPKSLNPLTGDVPPGVEMVPPLQVAFEMRCKQGHLVKTVPSEALLQPTVCPHCRLPVTKTDMRVQKTVTKNRGFEQIGAYCFDGLTSMLSWGLMDLGHRAGRLELKGEEAAIGGKVVSGELKFGGTTRSHVGFVQARGEEFVALTLGIQGLVVPPTFTALVHEDVDDRALSIVGPKISGRAKTDEAPQWFGNCLETTKEPNPDGKPGEQFVLHLSEYTDSYNRRHLCKHRGSPGTMPTELRDPVEGLIDPALSFSEFNLGKFYTLLDAALENRIGQLQGRYANVAPPANEFVTFGDNSVREALSPQVQTGGPQVLQHGTGVEPTPQPPAVQAPQAQAPQAPAGPSTPKPRARRGAAAQTTAPTTTAPLTLVPPATQYDQAPAPQPPQEVEPPLPLEAQEPAHEPVQTAAPVVETPQAPPAPPTPPAPPAPPQAPAAPAAVARPGVAPPPGRRPGAAPPVMRGPGAPPAVAPRPPAAAPRPPAAVVRPPTPPANGSTSS